MAIDLEPGAIDMHPECAALSVVTPFRVDSRDDPAGLVLALHGEADLATAPLLAGALTHATRNGNADVVLDAGGLEFVDAYCLGIIANARTLLQQHGRDLVVRSPSTLVRRVLTIVDMQALIDPMDC